MVRIECQPGEEMQIDFGLGARIHSEGNAKSQSSWLFRSVLSYSRKGYSDAVFRQGTEAFVRCPENATRHFGGVPLMLNLDNLKAAVIKADWFDLEINPKLADFCRLYGIHVMSCRPRTPQHKGKVDLQGTQKCIDWIFGKAFRYPGRTPATIESRPLIDAA